MPKNFEPPAWRKRKEPVLDAEVQASVERGQPHAGEHTAEGHSYAELIYGGCESPERALEIKNALFRSAMRLRVSISAKIVKNGDVWDVRYTARCKDCARMYIVATYGPDRQAWPYNPRERMRRD